MLNPSRPAEELDSQSQPRVSLSNPRIFQEVRYKLLETDSRILHHDHLTGGESSGVSIYRHRLLPSTWSPDEAMNSDGWRRGGKEESGLVLMFMFIIFDR